MRAADPDTAERAALSRDRIVRAALRYIDTYGLAGLSMHKLGGELGVKGMSLYNHVASKDDLLNGVVEHLWDEVEDAAPGMGDWLVGYRHFAHAIRDTAHRHPNAAPLITSQSIMPVPALRAIKAHITTATDAGIPEERAYDTLRTLTSYALGTALNELAWGRNDGSCRQTDVSELLQPDMPTDLAAVAKTFCGETDLNAQFDLGLNLMLGGVDIDVSSA